MSKTGLVPNPQDYGRLPGEIGDPYDRVLAKTRKKNPPPPTDGHKAIGDKVRSATSAPFTRSK